MSDKRYGFMREVEADFLDEILAKLLNQFNAIRFLEIGVFGGGTVTGVYRRAKALNCPCYCAGVDFAHWKPAPAPDPGYTFYEGDSMDQWRNIKERFNLLFVDGCHCVNHCMTDFCNYSPLVVVGGYCLFHDTATPTGVAEQGQWPQDHSYAGKPPSELGVRDGIKKLGLLQGHRTDWELVTEIASGDGLMGMMCFVKRKEL